MPKFVHIVGARPNFMKAAPVFAALKEKGVQQILVHTGQHYDSTMSDVFFHQLGMAEPEFNLQVGSGSHATQTAEIMIRLEKVLLVEKPDWVIVYGDVNSTMAAALVASKLLIKIAHVEAGLRSGDRTMPEEINRLVTDQVADLLFTPSYDGDVNLIREGVAPEKIRFVGNVMIDSLVRLLPQAEALWLDLQEKYSLERYGLITLHRPSNVDDHDTLSRIIAALRETSSSMPYLFPVHPRTRRRIADGGIFLGFDTLKMMDPLGYVEFIGLQKHATLVITDSGGIQEETTYLDVPCLTIRENTERPVTVTLGTNVLVGHDMAKLKDEVARILVGSRRRGSVPPLWDGSTSQRIAGDLCQY